MNKKKYKFDIEVREHSMLAPPKRLESDPMTIKQIESYLKNEAKNTLKNSKKVRYISYVAWENDSNKSTDELLLCLVLGMKSSEENIHIYSNISSK